MIEGSVSSVGRFPSVSKQHYLFLAVTETVILRVEQMWGLCCLLLWRLRRPARRMASRAG